MALTEKQKKHLRRVAHPMNPIVMLGNAGMTDAVVAELDRALTDIELVKVSARVGDRGVRNQVLATLAGRTTSELVQRIGHVGVFYRPPRRACQKSCHRPERMPARCVTATASRATGNRGILAPNQSNDGETGHAVEQGRHPVPGAEAQAPRQCLGHAPSPSLAAAPTRRRHQQGRRIPPNELGSAGQQQGQDADRDAQVGFGGEQPSHHTPAK